MAASPLRGGNKPTIAQRGDSASGLFGVWIEDSVFDASFGPARTDWPWPPSHLSCHATVLTDVADGYTFTFFSTKRICAMSLSIRSSFNSARKSLRRSTSRGVQSKVCDVANSLISLRAISTCFVVPSSRTSESAFSVRGAVWTSYGRAAENASARYASIKTFNLISRRLLLRSRTAASQCTTNQPTIARLVAIKRGTRSGQFIVNSYEGA